MLLTFAQARPEDDAPVVLDILDEAAGWLHDRGIEQWPAKFGGVDGWRADRITKYVEAGESWLVLIDGDPAATFSLTQTSDPDYADGWPEGPEDALYIFRMAVRRRWAGLNLGALILDWASARAMSHQLSWLRLDCHRRNRALQSYYERHGFTRVNTVVRTIDDNGAPYTRGSGALYQRPAGTVHCPTPGDATVTDRYDPQGEAAIWQEASSLIVSLKRTDEGSDQWNSALEQAARMLENEARGIRQKNGMYYRVISGTKHYQPASWLNQSN